MTVPVGTAYETLVAALAEAFGERPAQVRASLEVLMPVMVDAVVAELVDFDDVAQMMGLAPSGIRQTVNKSRRTDNPFPGEIVRLGISPGYLRYEVVEWMDRRVGRGRPPKHPQLVTRLRSRFCHTKAEPDKHWLTLSDLSEFLHLSPDTVLDLPGLPGRRFHHKGQTAVRYRVEDVAEWVRKTSSLDR